MTLEAVVAEPEVLILPTDLFFRFGSGEEHFVSDENITGLCDVFPGIGVLCFATSVSEDFSDTEAGFSDVNCSDCGSQLGGGGGGGGGSCNTFLQFG